MRLTGRALNDELSAQQPVDQANTRAQLRILQKRARLLRKAIILVSISILLASILIISLFFAALLRWDIGWLILFLFIGCMATLIVSVLAFIQDVNQSLLALQLELGENATDETA